ncbi:MAG TPA: hypothetical protein VGI99_12990 [Gemmataceae bacterium]
MFFDELTVDENSVRVRSKSGEHQGPLLLDVNGVTLFAARFERPTRYQFRPSGTIRHPNEVLR